MKRNSMPLILMLVAGAVTCIITFIQNYPIWAKLLSLLIVLIVFYFLGSLLKWTIDTFEKQNEIKNKEEGEVIEKDAEGVTEKEDRKKEKRGKKKRQSSRHDV